MRHLTCVEAVPGHRKSKKVKKLHTDGRTCSPPAQVMHGGNARLAHLFSCLPTTFVLPKEGPVFADAFAKALHGVEPSVTQPKGLNLWWVWVPTYFIAHSDFLLICSLS